MAMATTLDSAALVGRHPVSGWLVGAERWPTSLHRTGTCVRNNYLRIKTPRYSTGSIK